jgi:uncharacterized protein (DUF433 family)
VREARKKIKIEPRSSLIERSFEMSAITETELLKQPDSLDHLSDLIIVHPDLVSGAPCFAGTRVPVKNLFDYLEGGESLDDFLEGFPGVSREQAIGVLHLAEVNLLNSLKG